MGTEELTFGKVVAMEAEIEDAAKAANLTMYSDKATDTVTPVNKVNLAKTAPKQKESGETVLGKSTSGFKRGHVHGVARKGILPKIASTLRPRAITVGKRDVWNPCVLKRGRAA